MSFAWTVFYLWVKQTQILSQNKTVVFFPSAQVLLSAFSFFFWLLTNFCLGGISFSQMGRLGGALRKELSYYKLTEYVASLTYILWPSISGMMYTISPHSLNVGHGPDLRLVSRCIKLLGRFFLSVALAFITFDLHNTYAKGRTLCVTSVYFPFPVHPQDTSAVCLRLGAPFLSWVLE